MFRCPLIFAFVLVCATLSAQVAIQTGPYASAGGNQHKHVVRAPSGRTVSLQRSRPSRHSPRASSRTHHMVQKHVRASRGGIGLGASDNRIGGKSPFQFVRFEPTVENDLCVASEQLERFGQMMDLPRSG